MRLADVRAVLRREKAGQHVRRQLRLGKVAGAVAVDPATGLVYETEDAGDSGFYRFIPNTPGVLVNGGVLEMLKIRNVTNYDTRTGQTPGVPLPVEWVRIDDPNPPGQGSNAVYDQGYAKGAAIFTRLEGCWAGNGAIYFDPRYVGNPLVYCGCIGVMPRERVHGSVRRGDRVVYTRSHRVRAARRCAASAP